jgi:hypothetical protein
LDVFLPERSAKEIIMRTIMRMLKSVLILALPWAIGSLPSCGTMGGGGMKYLVDPPSVARAVT